jgi:hypothetical protein
MIIGSHNSWSYLPPKKWWMKLIAFTARCQSDNIVEQYTYDGVRCFDLRVRFKDDKPIVAHGIIEYDISEKDLFESLEYLNLKGDVFVRILHEVRTKKQYTEEAVENFVDFIIKLQTRFTNIRFWCGKNLYNWETDYEFPCKLSCEEKYASVCPPKLIDNWYPRWFAKENNKEILSQEHNVDFLMIDFVNYQ